MIHLDFERTARAMPHRTAIEAGGAHITYETLHGRAASLCGLLRQIGVQRDVITAVMLPPGANLVTALLAVFRSGGVYLPIDINFSPKRLLQIFTQTETQLVITEAGMLPQVQALLAALNVSVQHLLVLDETASPTLLRAGVEGYTETDIRSLPSVTTEAAVKPDDSNYIFYTSGSTGEAKAIVGKHESLAHFIHWEIGELCITEQHRVSQLVQFTFDASLRDIFVALCSGATLCIPDEATKANTGSLVRWIADSRVTLIHSVPSLIRMIHKELLTEPRERRFPSLQYVLMAGELLFSKDIHTFRELIGDHVELVNLYGPSETTLVKTFHRIKEVPSSPSKAMHVGKPISDTAIIILNNGRLCRIGEAGEIYIRTKYMTKGYYKNPALTAAVFVQNPLVKDKEDIVYKTGDMGRYLHDRSIEVLGRLDEQVKINGIRVELNEIRQAVLGMPGIQEAVVTAVRNSDQQQELVCYYTGASVDAAALQQFLRGVLNASIIPGYFIRLEQFPLNSNGKIDKKALPRPDSLVLNEADYEPVAGETEQKLEAIWKELTGLQKIGRKISFFRIGGNSLKVTQLVSRVYKAFEVNLRITDVFNHPDIASLAALIDSSRQTAYDNIPQAPEQETYELSFGQKRLWVLNTFSEGRSSYNMCNAFRFKGILHIPALRQAFDALLKRHEILRTTFETINDLPRQRIHDAAGYPFQVALTDLQALEDKEVVLQAQVAADAATCFNLSEGPLLKVTLYQLDTDEYVLMIVMHHIISDGWSVDILFQELTTLYQAFQSGRDAALPPLRIQYRDYVYWLQQQLAGEEANTHRRYWLDRFSSHVPKLELSPDYPRPAVKTYNGATVSAGVNAELVRSLNTLAQQHNVSLFMVLQAALKTLLYRYSRQEDIVVGTPVAGRSHQDLEGQLGFYVNTLALRTQFSGQRSFAELLEQVKATTLGAFEHGIYPFDLLVNELNLERDTSRSPLFDVMLVLHSTVAGRADITDQVSVFAYPFQTAACKFDLIFNITETDERLQLTLEYNTDLFRKARMENMLSHYLNLLAAVAQHSDLPLYRLEYLSAQEKQQILYAFNDTVTPYSINSTLHGLFEAQVQRTPEAPALRFRGRDLSYATLNREANRVASFLLDKGVRSGDNVGLITGRGFDMIIAMYGILKAGAAYVPIDPAYPADRQLYIIRNSGVQLVLVDNTYPVAAAAQDLQFVPLSAAASPAYADSNPGIPKSSRELAYTIYTSGSTGRPKGVMIAHHAAVNLVEWVNKRFETGPQDRLLFITSMCFDLSVYDIFGMLAAGGTVVIAQQDEVTDIERLKVMMQEERITFWDSVPTTMNFLVNEIAEDGNDYTQQQLRVVFMSGDWIPVALPQRIRRYFPQAQVISLGGATEGTVWSNYYPVLEDMSQRTSIPYGKPIWNNFFYILDEHRQPVPQGVIGELYIGGAGVAEGYANDEEKTAASFVPDPFNTQLGGRMYRTGDLGRMLPDWNMEFIGRKDHQVKIRGFRVELGEIKNVMLQHPSIKEVVLVAKDDVVSGKYLAAYFIGNGPVSIGALRSHLGAQLPDYMIPSCFIEMDSFPLNSNGKIDLKALPAPALAATSTGSFAAPEGEREQVLAAVWRSVLGREQISATDNFFMTGGDSIKCIQVVARLKRAGYSVKTSDIFQYPTIRQLAPVMTTHQCRSRQDAITGEFPLTPIQHEFFSFPYTTHHHFNVSVVFRVKERLDRDTVHNIFSCLQTHHDALRLTFRHKDGRIVQTGNGVKGPLSLKEYDFRNEADPRAMMEAAANELQASMDLEHGPLLQLGLFHLPEEDRLLFTAHHLVIDTLSWRILLEDMETLYHQHRQGQPLQLPPKTDAYMLWAEQLAIYANSDALLQEKPYWAGVLAPALPAIKRDFEEGSNYLRDKQQLNTSLDEAATQQLLSAVHKAYHTQMNDILLAALAASVQAAFGNEQLRIMLIGHGREPVTGNIDLSRTVGWFSSFYPVLLEAPAGAGLPALIQHTRETLAAIPHKGIGYSILKHLTHPDRKQDISFKEGAQITFNYWGQFDEDLSQSSFEIADGPVGQRQRPDDQRTVELDVLAMIADKKLILSVQYSKQQYRADTIRNWLEQYRDILQSIIRHCCTGAATPHSHTVTEP